MKTHTTNYTNTLIEIAEDSPVSASVIPVVKNDKKTIANYQYEKLSKHPLKYTSDELLFDIFVERNDISPSELEEEKQKFFSKGQACLRTSPLAKKNGFGIFHNEDSKVRLIPAESEEYQQLLKDNAVKKVKAMKSKR
ncbi:DUF6157 family protein [Epilithonimonas pallida]|uniref:Uncharacterized protein n=1 Tax=Epilithonimonas pallida TaxID=373671 RepID=A0ABY1R5D3_9FLAO|nr:DUF6157 family protein [Epilithonimonas pallida]SMP92000.1 hypothetical protein SAMN05421679_103416 [Epilithonimonas pallida]